HRDRALGTYGGLLHFRQHIVAILHRLLLEGNNHVAGLDARLLGWPAGRNLFHEDTVIRAVRLQQFRLGAGIEADPDGAPRHFADANDIVVNLGHHINGDSESQALEAARLGFDGAVDADDLAADIDQRTAAVALIDGGIG